MPPLTRNTTPRKSLPVPKARPISTSVCNTMTPRITPVSRPWHSTTNWPCCFTCCVKPYNYARLMADCAPKQDVRSELTLLFDMIAELDCAAITTHAQAHSHASR